MVSFSEYARYDALGLAELVRKREVTPAELVECAIARIEKVNPRLNAVVEKAYDSARAEARASGTETVFAGVPFLLKDALTFCRGMPFHNGSRFFAGFRPEADSELVARFRRAGLVLLGTTNTPELAILPFTEPERFGPTVNPWARDRSPGGSSGGAAAAVAARLVPMAQASDGGGSIRAPASCCGIFGMKTTRGRTPLGPFVGDSWHGATVAHVVSVSVRDSAALLDAVAGADAGAPYALPAPERPFLADVARPPRRLRIALSGRAVNGTRVHADCLAALEDAGKLCESLGHHVEEAAPEVDGERLFDAFLLVIASSVAAELREARALLGRAPRRGELEPTTELLELLARQYTAADLSHALRHFGRVSRDVSRFFDRYDVVLTPTLSRPPARTGELRARGLEAFAHRLIASLQAGGVLRWRYALRMTASKLFSYTVFTPLWNVTGQPAMSVPLFWNGEGLPIGVQFAGRFGDEATLFSLAGELEAARPWRDKLPPVIREG